MALESLAMECYEQIDKFICGEGELPKVQNVEEMLNSALAMTERENSMVVIYYTLMSYYDSNVKHQRLLKLKEHGSITDIKNPKMKGIFKKPSRSTCIPKCVFDMQQIRLKVVLAIFLSNKLNVSSRRDLIANILKDAKMSMTDIVEYSDNVKKINTQPEIDQTLQANLCGSLINMANISGEGHLSKLAYQINPTLYYEYLQHQAINNRLVGTAACEMLINKYLSTCVAPYLKDSERVKIHNQFKVNVAGTALSLIAEIVKGRIEKPIESLFDPDILYTYFKDANGFTKHLRIASLNENGKRFRIILYHDCLYDVLGYSQNTESGIVYKMFDNMRWEERLKQVSYRSHVNLDLMKGDQLNAMTGKFDVAIDWLDENGYCKQDVKTLKIKKAVKIENQMEHQTGDVMENVPVQVSLTEYLPEGVSITYSA